MKSKTVSLLTLASAAFYGLSACDKHDHDHADHDHDHDKKGGKEEAGHKDGHEHAKKAGPSGGRVLTEFEPHAEFFVTDDRKVQITFVDDDYKPVPAAEQVVSIVAGDRSSPTVLAFEKAGDVLISDKALPAADDFPVVVQIKENAAAEFVNAKFQANMLECPTCDYLEYACVCDHDGDEEE